MNFLIHNNLPKLPDLLAGCGHVQVFSGRVPPQELLATTDVLLIRSVTTVDQELLEHAPQLKFLGTGTIGMDHVDGGACERLGIPFFNTPGANAISVGEYVLAAALEVAERQQLSLVNRKALVVGAGHTGSEAGKRLSALGMDVSYIDPSPVLAADNKDMTDWGALEQADLVTLHVPLTKNGPLATHHLLDKTKLLRMKKDAILINASRGEVLDNYALLNFLRVEPTRIHVVLDVWEGEPQVLCELVPEIALATPHIAGHSIEGKLRSSYLLYEQVLQCIPELAQEKSWQDIALAPFGEKIQWQSKGNDQSLQQQVHRVLKKVYDISADDAAFRCHGLTPEGFDRLRQNYAVRRELSALILQCSPSDYNTLQAIGFGVELLPNPA